MDFINFLNLFIFPWNSFIYNFEPIGLIELAVKEQTEQYVFEWIFPLGEFSEKLTACKITALGPKYFLEMDGNLNFKLKIRQEPLQARMCGFTALPERRML